MANEPDKKDEKAPEEKALKPAKLGPGRARIRYKFDHYSADWGAPELHRQGKEMEVDAEVATTKMAEYGPSVRGKILKKDGTGTMPGDKITELGCPFEIIEGNKAVAGAPETK